ncbi:MAG: hypothetical protein V4702_04420 [Patescibacteria group bacterium]
MKDFERETLVVKFGSSSVANQQGMDMERLGLYAAHLAEVSQQYNLVVVTSGSVAVGQAMWGESDRREHMLSDRSAAMMGSARAVTAWAASPGYLRSVGRSATDHT